MSQKGEMDNVELPGSLVTVIESRNLYFCVFSV